LVSASRRNRLFCLFNSETKVRDGEDALARHAGRVRYPEQIAVYTRAFLSNATVDTITKRTPNVQTIAAPDGKSL